MTQYKALTNDELLRVAEMDTRYQQDPLFTELVLRLMRGTDRGIRIQPSSIDTKRN